ncbi:MAG: IS110 family transposase [Actinobacteria bacterium]|nr:IS110 family transposase [Actinomycetota bacterium]
MTLVIGVDPHKQTHTAVAVRCGSGELVDELTTAARPSGHGELVAWAQAIDRDRVWALEDVRRVSRGLERFLLEAGERVLRVPPKLMAGARKGARTFGKSDSIDALAIARAALAYPELPIALQDEPAREIRLLIDHREALVRQRSEAQDRLRWLLHDLDPDLRIPAGALDRKVWLDRVARRLARREQSVAVRIARDLVRRCRELTRDVNELEREVALRVAEYAPQLLELKGCGALIAGKIIGETAGITRFRSDAQFARLTGVAPLDASSGQQRRHRLSRHGNRQLNSALHKIAIVQGRWDPRARAYLQRKQAAGKSRLEALRALKRHLARIVFRLLRQGPGDSPGVIKVRGGKARSAVRA